MEETMKQTLQEKYAAALIARGCTEVIPSRSRKYRTFNRAKGGFYFLGASGAIRIGHRSSHSIAVGDAFKAKLLEEVKS
jgi:hypothetical protein